MLYKEDLSYNILSFHVKLKIFLWDFTTYYFLWSFSKPVIKGTMYLPPGQNDVLELLNSNMNKINWVDDENSILGDFNIKLFLTTLSFSKKIIS